MTSGYHEKQHNAEQTGDGERVSRETLFVRQNIQDMDARSLLLPRRSRQRPPRRPYPGRGGPIRAQAP